MPIARRVLAWGPILKGTVLERIRMGEDVEARKQGMAGEHSALATIGDHAIKTHQSVMRDEPSASNGECQYRRAKKSKRWSALVFGPDSRLSSNVSCAIAHTSSGPDHGNTWPLIVKP